MPAPSTARDPALDEALISIWQQTLVEQKKIVNVGGSTYSVRRTSKHRLAQVDFAWHGVEYRGLEENPQTASRWAKLAREGAKVMQFLQAGKYIGVVADGAMKRYGPRRQS
jgi:NADPH-dependent ferric siderophore reductase